MRSLGFLLLLAAAALAAPPALEVPKEAAGEPSAFIRVEAKDRERRRGELLVRLKSDDVPLVAGMSHPLKKDKKGA